VFVGGSGTCVMDSESSVEATLALIYIKCLRKQVTHTRPLPPMRVTRRSNRPTFDLITIDQYQSRQGQPGYID